MLAEALETTVLSETCKKEDIWITNPPNIHENNLKNINDNNDEDDDDKFEEMSKQSKEVIEEEDCNEFEEMSKNNPEADNDDEDEIMDFKIKEEDIDEDDDNDYGDDNHEAVSNNLIDVETTATSANLTKSVDLLGNDIVKSIEKANLLYDGGDKKDFSKLFKPSSVGNGMADNLVCSSEDDLEFKPVTSGRKNKKKQKNKNNTDSAKTDSSCSVELGSSFADSESSDAQMQEKSTSNTEGWSFEADDLDVNKLLSEVIPPTVQDESGAAPSMVAEVQLVEEKAALEDVFKFDSELGSNESKKASVPTELNSMSTSLHCDDSQNDSQNSDEKSNSLSQSMTYGGCSTATSSNNDESSAANSPNPRAASKKKGKSKKKKR